MLTDDQLNFFKENNIVVLATANKDGQPRAILVEANKTENDKIIVTDNEMEMTRQNILNNKNVFVLAYSEDHNRCLKIEGTANYETEGENFEYTKGLESNKDYMPKAAVVINISNVTEA